MLVLPCVVISASATPLPLTRARTMSTAWRMLSGVGSLPSGVLADSVMLVPPRKSRPSRGVHSPSTAMVPYITTRSSASTPSERHGRGALVDATVGRSPSRHSVIREASR